MLGDWDFRPRAVYSISLVKNSNAIARWHKLIVGILALTELQCGHK